jgi:hypothetical protein
VLEPGGRLAACITHPLNDAGQFESDAADARLVIKESYFGWRPFRETFSRGGLTITFQGYVGALEDYARALEEAGFLIERLREPAVPAAVVDRNPGAHRRGRVPNFLHLLAVRP